MITWVGMVAASRHLLIMLDEGVSPPIYKALTNYMRSAEQSSIVVESAGLVEMTYVKTFFDLISKTINK